MKKIKRVTAEEMHELILDLSIDEYYKLFELMFTHVTNFIYEAEKLANKYNKEKLIPLPEKKERMSK